MRITSAVWLAWQIVLTQANAQCSDSPGSCQAPKASLMQRKTIRQKQKLQSTFTSQLASFQKFADEMIAKYGKGDEDPFTSPSITTAVKTVLEFIETMYGSLKSYHDSDKMAADSCMTKGRQCEDVHLTDTQVDTILRDNKTTNIKHTKFLECMDDRSKECGKENEQCDRYDTYRQQQHNVPITGGWVIGDGSTPQFLPACVEAGDFGDAFIKANAEGSDQDKQKLKDMEACLEKTNTWLNGNNPPPSATDEIEPLVQQHDGLYPHFENCDRTVDECKGLHKKCEIKQDNFENSYCTYEVVWDSSCGAWKHCFDAATLQCTEPNGICENISNNVLGRKADNETGLRLKCLLQVLFGAFDGENFAPRLPGVERAAALQACTDADHNLDAWDIACGVGDGTYMPDICSGTCPSNPDTKPFKTSYYYNFQLREAVEPPYKEEHGINKNIFPSRAACDEWRDHSFCNVGVKIDGEPGFEPEDAPEEERTTVS